MNSLKNKRFYKVISLFTKTMILLLSFYYIWEKIKTANNTIDFTILRAPSHRIIFLSVLLLMLVNWGLESIKWKMLIAPLEKISFFKSIQSILAGVTISIFTPNRVGEFTGRIFFLERADKIQATFMSMIGSIMQLSVTLIAGIVAYFILNATHYYTIGSCQFISIKGALFLISGIVLFTAVVVFIYFKRNTLFVKYKKYIEIMSLYPIFKITAVFLLSLIRYIVFATQYYLVLKLLGIDADAIVLFSLIALTFFVTSIVPTFALTEIAVRGATAVYFFNIIHADPTSVVEASLLLWLINLALPALTGALFIWKLKFFKDSN